MNAPRVELEVRAQKGTIEITGSFETGGIFHSGKQRIKNDLIEVAQPVAGVKEVKIGWRIFLWRWNKKDNWGQPGKRINARSERQPDPPQSGALPFTSVLRPQTVYDRPAE